MKFDETCCTDNGVPEECMGLCREKTDRDVEEIMPIDRCEEHRETIRTCMKVEGAGNDSRNVCKDNMCIPNHQF